MTDELYNQAERIKCRIKDLNHNLDTIEMLREKYVEDSELDIILQNSIAHNFNEIQRLKQVVSFGSNSI